MAGAREMTQRFIDAYNRRDRGAMRELLPATPDYVRWDVGRLGTADEVMAQYERDWAILESARVVVRDLIESGDRIIAEITLEATVAGRSGAVEGVVAHRWRDGKMVRYRSYQDPLPAQVAALRAQHS